MAIGKGLKLATSPFFLALCLFFCFSAWHDGEVSARSAYSPRHTGIEPPGGPRRLEAIPGNSPSRTAEGGMGYKDAYGNTLEDRPPPEKKQRQRPRPGAYGSYGKKEDARAGSVIPDNPGPPLWTFH